MASPDPEAVVAAAKQVGIHEMVLRMPQGYDTRIMAGGLMLTPGQRQRIALARAFYGSPKLVILDEPNSNLDAEGEGALNASLVDAQRRGITIVVIAHRLGILRHVTKILILRDGIIEALDQRDVVLAKLAQRARDEGATGTVVPIGGVAARPSTS
jgi:ABC-type protease/lipase transport system fused ATPase/permease subunit